MEELNSEDENELNDEELPKIENNKKSIISFAKLNKYFLFHFYAQFSDAYEFFF